MTQGACCWGELLAGWMGGGLPWQETRAKPVSMEVGTKVLGVLDQPLGLPRVLDLLSRELGKLPRMPAAEGGLPARREAELLTDGDALVPSTESQFGGLVVWKLTSILQMGRLKFIEPQLQLQGSDWASDVLFFGSMGEASQDAGPAQSLH